MTDTQSGNVMKGKPINLELIAGGNPAKDTTSTTRELRTVPTTKTGGRIVGRYVPLAPPTDPQRPSTD